MMKYSDNEKDFIKKLILFSSKFENTNVGFNFLSEFFTDEEIALSMNKSWPNGTYYLYYAKGNEEERYPKQLYKYIEILSLINKLEKDRLITIVPDNNPITDKRRFVLLTLLSMHH